MTGNPLPLAPICLRADNPSPLTGTGTNSYLLGQERLTLIDPGPDLDSHLDSILKATRGRPLDRIIVTHAHRDHSALAPRLAALTGAEILAFGTATDGISPRMAALATQVSPTGEGLDTTFQPDRRLTDGEVIPVDGAALTVLHTPGHLGGHICLSSGGLLFSGDHVMGWATSIVSPPEGDMTDYMASLDRLSRLSWQTALPGHGPAIHAPATRIAELIAHRRAREAQIIAELGRSPATPQALTAVIYRDTPKALWPAAERNVLAHLLDLEGRNRVSAMPRLSADAKFALV